VLVIQTEDLTKDYAVGFWRKRPRRALDRLTLGVEQGEIFGFLGPNGAGKTTTLKLLMQLVYPTSGRASILGLPAGDLALKRRIGYLPEHPYFYDHLTAEELLRYFAGLFGLSGAGRDARVSALLDAAGIGAERRLPLRKYSKGMLQRVGIAQAILNEPEVVFFDEPMSGLDPLGRRDMRALIMDLRRRGCTVFFSSHILSDAEALCDRVAMVARGRLVAQGRIADLVAFEVKGWELIVSDCQAEWVARLGDQVKVTVISSGRYSLELPGSASPTRELNDIVGCGARLVSLNPIRETLEDAFVRHVGGQEGQVGQVGQVGGDDR
jgi:ABC-2 type transport system ATP-binding protein